MPRRRILRLSKYYIDKDRYNELLYFCKQYQSRQEEIKHLRGLKSVSMDGMPKGNTTGNPTESSAMKINKLEEENTLIEQAAAEADRSIGQYIVKNVTIGIKFEYMNAPCGREYFYKKRRQFFKILSERR